MHSRPGDHGDRGEAELLIGREGANSQLVRKNVLIG
jgi:hypothetical protein